MIAGRGGRSLFGGRMALYLLIDANNGFELYGLSGLCATRFCSSLQHLLILFSYSTSATKCLWFKCSSNARSAAASALRCACSIEGAV